MPVVGLAEVSDKRHDETPAKEFGEAAHALADFRVHDVGLSEAAWRRVQDQRLLALQLWPSNSVSRVCHRSAMRAAIRTASGASLS